MTIRGRLALAAASALVGVGLTWLAYRSIAVAPPRPLVAARRMIADPPRPAGATLWLLSIGVSDYLTPELRLAFADADARAVAERVDRVARGAPFEQVHSLVLTNEEVTRESMLNGLADFFGQAGPNDVAMLFLAGHGVRDLRSGSFYFLPRPANSENLLTEGLRLSDFDDTLSIARRNVRAVVVMLDTCHAGAFDLPLGRIEAAAELPGQISAGEGFFLIAAARPGEKSNEIAALGHGAFTYALLEALDGAADANADGRITASEFFGYVAQRVPELADGAQHPYHKIEGTDLVLFDVTRSATPHPSPALVAAVVLPTRGNGDVALNTIGVMEFENLRSDPEHEWIRDALRVAFNTELSKVKALRVYSPELIDRTARRRGSDALSTARELGIGRLISGSYHVTGDTLRIDARLVDAASGLNEASDSVEGRQDDFFGLQKRLVLSMLRRLRVRVSPEEGESIQTETNTDVDAYRLLLEAEGFDAPAPPAERTRTVPGEPSPQSLRAAPPRWFAFLSGTAYAEESAPEADPSVVEFLERYGRAIEAKDMEAVALLYTSFSERQRAALAGYFETAKDLSVQLTDVKVTPEDPGMAVTFTRRDEFTDAKSGRPVRLEVRLTKILVREDGEWKIGGKK